VEKINGLTVELSKPQLNGGEKSVIGFRASPGARFSDVVRVTAWPMDKRSIFRWSPNNESQIKKGGEAEASPPDYWLVWFYTSCPEIRRRWLLRRYAQQLPRSE